MSQESVLGLQTLAEGALVNGQWPSDEPETLNGSSRGHDHDDIEEEDEHPMADGGETELELGDGEDATVKVTRKAGPPPMIDTEVAVSGPSPTSVAAETGGASPSGSTRSLPTVVEPHRPGTPAAQSAQAASFSQASLESARTQFSRRTNNTDNNNPPPSPSRRHLHTRSTPQSEPTRSPNRLSGFFTNLIHRNIGPVPPSPLGSTQGERAATPAEDSANPSRSSSPAPPPRPATPPPSLPPPSLQELGLSLSVLTNDLSPSHFSTPPASGAFLAPHYLLLCHAQGLDVLPLVSPPAPQPYALIRRVPFKSVVVMEHRGVLVAIAGRRDGVRVYALDEVKKAVEWRLDVEIRRERDRQRREELKRGGPPRESLDKRSEMNITPSSTANSRTSMRRASSMIVPQRASGKKPKSHTTPPALLPPRPVTPPAPAAPPSIPQVPNVSRPPSYRSPSPPARPEPQAPPQTINLSGRRSSVTNVLGGAPRTSRPSEDLIRTASEKAEWLEGSDEEDAINVMTAGPSGSQALDERTSAMAAAHSPTMATNMLATPRPSAPTLSPATSTTLTPTQGRRRPPDLQLDEAQRTPGRPAPPSPTPTLLTLQQALMASPRPAHGSLARPTDGEPSDGDDDGDPGSRTPTNERLTFAEMLMESRIPDLAPPGTRVPQEAQMLTHSHALTSGDDDSSAPGSPTASARSIQTARSRASQDTQRSAGTSTNANPRRRRRWSVLDGIFATSPTQAGSAPPEQTASPTSTEMPPLPAPSQSLAPPPRPSTASSTNSGARERRSGVLQRTQSSSRRPSSAGGRSTGGRSTGGRSASVSASVPPRPATSGGSTDVPPVPTPPSRFLSRLLGGAFHSRRSEDSAGETAPETHKSDRKAGSITATQAPAPKLEYVKLPGTKGALLIKAVETNKKSFLAILCGDNGEKVELFAGTYRTALGLSRTFILPDSPRSLELQLQGDDLVEVFLVFAQNVFGLEPATVRVREVRIGRAERRAARRRARELRDAGGAAGGEDGGQDDATSAPLEETTTTTVSVSVGVASEAATTATATGPGTSITPVTTPPTTGAGQDEILAVAAAQMGPYTTFQQLPFSPHFPLAAIADEYVIPPTYPDFLEYRATHEPEDGSDAPPPTIESTAFSPPGLPLPTPSGPSNWFYRDPKGNIHGPWNAGQMQTWYREGLLPLDLPVRREEDTEYLLLRDLRQQCIDPSYPFRSAPPARTVESGTVPAGLGPLPPLDPSKPLLQPLSLLTQSRIFGPPALFYSTRGGHSTVIVDGRGRSVLKGRFLWSRDASVEDMSLPLPPLPGSGRLGDVKRLEAFDVDSARSVLVAVRQGGFEAVDFADALLRPADASRHVLPQFATTPSQINRRAPFTWKIGMPVGTATSSATSLAPLKGPSRLLHAPVKKLSTGPGKSPSARSEFGSGTVPDGESEHTRDEIIFLGRREDNVYICERNGGAFRILRLSPSAARA